MQQRPLLRLHVQQLLRLRMWQVEEVRRSPEGERGGLRHRHQQGGGRGRRGEGGTGGLHATFREEEQGGEGREKGGGHGGRKDATPEEKSSSNLPSPPPPPPPPPLFQGQQQHSPLRLSMTSGVLDAFFNFVKLLDLWFVFMKGATKPLK